MVAIPAGGFSLEAEAVLVPGAPAALVCHPHPAFGGRMDSPLVITLAGALRAVGFSTVRFNFRGLGCSGGKATGGQVEHQDVQAVAEWVRQSGAPSVALVGYSFGALMAARAIAAGTAAEAYAAVGFPTTMICGDPARESVVERALDARVPWLFTTGDGDRFSEVDRLRAWAAPRSWVRLDVLRHTGHFFADEAARQLGERVAGFVAGAIGRAG